MGLDLGFELQGDFELLACVEKERIFCDTIEANVRMGNFAGNPRVFCEDLMTFEPAELMTELGIKSGEIDVLIGGPPCQAFSTAGRRQSVQDRRGTLLWRYLEFVKALQPKIFVMENVRGLLSASLKHRPISERPENGGPPLDISELPGSVIETFIKDLTDTCAKKYHLDIFEVNSVNYGAPQIRERAIFIGNSLGKNIDFPMPTHGNSTKHSQSLFSFDETKPWRTLRDAIGDLRENDPELSDFSPRKKQFLGQVPAGGNWRSLPVEIQKESMGRAWFAKGGRSGWWRRLSWDFPCPTLVTMPNHASTSLCHPEEIRVLSVKEYARIQEFPDNWIFCGKTAQKYTQIGNAVPVRLGMVAADCVSQFLKSIEHQTADLSYQPASAQVRRTYIHSHVRTRRWFKNGEAVAGELVDNLEY